MSDGDNFDEYEKYNFEQDKYEQPGSGKHRSKKEGKEMTQRVICSLFTYFLLFDELRLTYETRTRVLFLSLWRVELDND